MSTVKQNLIKVRELIKEPTSWMKGDYNNDMCGTREPTCFCILGAIAATKDIDDSDACDSPEAIFLRDLAGIEPACSVALFNDDAATTHADILALLDKAIEQAE